MPRCDEGSSQLDGPYTNKSGVDDEFVDGYRQFEQVGVYRRG